MAVIEELIRKEADGTLSFGNYLLPSKQKLSDFEYDGDSYKVKTFKEITKLERNGMFVYESVPGTVVTSMKMEENRISFTVEGTEDSQITLEMEAEKEYDVVIDGKDYGKMKTNLGGKLSISIEMDKGQQSKVEVSKSE